MDYNNNYQQQNYQQNYQPRNAQTEHELGWDDEITKESEFVLLEPGVYPFVVKSFSRGRFNGSAKMSACPEAILDIEIVDQASGSKVTLKESLKLHTKMEWKLSEFFVSIGQKRKGEPLRMNWNAVTGARGMLELNHRTHNGNTYNNINKFLPPEQSQTQTQTQSNYVNGRF